MKAMATETLSASRGADSASRGSTDTASSVIMDGTQLSDDVLMLIIKYLDVPSQWRLARTCKQWLRAVRTVAIGHKTLVMCPPPLFEVSEFFVVSAELAKHFRVREQDVLGIDWFGLKEDPHQLKTFIKGYPGLRYVEVDELTPEILTALSENDPAEKSRAPLIGLAFHSSTVPHEVWASDLKLTKSLKFLACGTCVEAETISFLVNQELLPNLETFMSIFHSVDFGSVSLLDFATVGPKFRKLLLGNRTIDHGHTSTDEFTSQIKSSNLTLLTHLEILGEINPIESGVNDVLRIISTTFQNLKKLSFRSFWNSEFDASVSLDSLDQFSHVTNLEELTFWASHLEIPAIELLLKNKRSLVKLDLFTEYLPEDLFAAIYPLAPQVKHLSVEKQDERPSSVDKSRQPVEAKYEDLKRFKNLVSLHLKNLRTDFDDEHLSLLYANCPELSDVDINLVELSAAKSLEKLAQRASEAKNSQIQFRLCANCSQFGLKDDQLPSNVKACCCGRQTKFKPSYLPSTENIF